MKSLCILIFALTLVQATAQRPADYIYLSDYVTSNSSNSIACLRTFYSDLLQFQAKGPDKFRFRYFDSYNCVKQPEPWVFDKVKNTSNPFYKPLVAELWKLYNDSYTKGGEIVAYIRLEDYKTNLDVGFALVRDMQGLHNKIAEIRKKIAMKVEAQTKTLATTNASINAYKAMLNVIVHEEALIEKLSGNLHEAAYTGFADEEILKSFLETEDLLPQINPTKFKLPYPASQFFNSCYEAVQSLQQTKRTALDDHNYITSIDGRYANVVYDNLLNYFNNDLLSFFTKYYEQIQTLSPSLINYPGFLRKTVTDAHEQSWTVKHLAYDAPVLDSVKVMKESSPLSTQSFHELSAILDYINDCVASLSNLFNELRSEESTWRSLRQGKMPYKNPMIKFDHFKIPASTYALIRKNSSFIAPGYRASLIARVDDLQNIMTILMDRTAGLSQYMSSGAFREKGLPFIEEELQTIQKLYEEFDLRKEALYYEVRKVNDAYPPFKTNSWMTAAAALLKATDDSRAILHKAEKKLFEADQALIITTALHDDQRELITNELRYMNGIERIGKNNGLCPYNPYEYIPDYLKTLEEKIQGLSIEGRDKKEAYRGVLYMHNQIVEQYNKFAELGLGANEYARNDPMRPVHILPHILQMMKFRYEPPLPEEKPKTPIPEPEAPREVPQEQITFTGYPFNNLVLLLDVSASMDKPDRLPLLKKDFQRLIKFMRPEDEVSIVVYSGKASVLLAPTSASDTTRIIRSIDRLRSEGKTNIADGMSLAYKTARKNFKADGNNRIILATDGEFNTGESLYALAEKNAEDITLTIFDFSQKDEPMKSIQTLAEKGKGNYVKVTSQNSLNALVNESKKGM